MSKVSKVISIDLRVDAYTKTKVQMLAYKHYENNMTALIREAIDRIQNKLQVN